MPRRVVTLHRWQVAAAFIAVTVAFVVATAIASSAARKAEDAALDAQRSTVALRRYAIENRRLVLEAQKVNTASCLFRAELAADEPRLQDQLDNAREFRDANPTGVQIGATRVTRLQLDENIAEKQSDLDNLREILEALSILECKEANAP
jgi:hypothetical protein